MEGLIRSKSDPRRSECVCVLFIWSCDVVCISCVCSIWLSVYCFICWVSYNVCRLECGIDIVYEMTGASSDRRLRGLRQPCSALWCRTGMMFTIGSVKYLGVLLMHICVIYDCVIDCLRGMSNGWQITYWSLFLSRRQVLTIGGMGIPQPQIGLSYYFSSEFISSEDSDGKTTLTMMRHRDADWWLHGKRWERPACMSFVCVWLTCVQMLRSFSLVCADDCTLAYLIWARVESDLHVWLCW